MAQDRKKFEFDYEVDGYHFNSLAQTEIRAKELLKQNYLQVMICKDSEPFEVFYVRNGSVCFQKIRNKGEHIV